MGLLVASKSCVPVDSIIERKAMLRCLATALRSVSSKTLPSSMLSIGKCSRCNLCLMCLSLLSNSNSLKINVPPFSRLSLLIDKKDVYSLRYSSALRFCMTSLGKHCNSSSKLSSVTRLLSISVSQNFQFFKNLFQKFHN